MCIDRIVPQTKAVEINHRKHEGGVIINVGTTEQIVEQAKKTKPKQVRNKSEDAVLAEVADELP
jgi:S-adenosylmethionine:tRNA-ribosyltransferase-isomerase (queuine synthetase)